MLPAIATMIAFYIVTQLVALGTRKGERSESSVARIMATLTIVITMLALIQVYQAGSSISRL